MLFLIICVAFLIRTINLKDNILFAYDQARDAQRVYNMVYKGDIKIVGPETDIPGVFHGPLLYYMLVPIYFFSNFNPNIAVFFFILINVATIILIYWGAKIIFKSNSVALVASLLWALSYEQGFFSRYISNTSPMSFTTSLFFIGLALFFLKDKQWGFPLSALGIALSIHSNFYSIYLFLFYPLFFAIFRKRPQLVTIFKTLVILIILLAPWIITEFRWNFIGTRSLMSYFIHQGTSSSSPISFLVSMFTQYYSRVSQGIYLSFFPHRQLGFVIVIVLLLYLLIKKRSTGTLFLLLWALNTVPLFAFKSGVHSVEIINSSIFVPLTILVAFGIKELNKIQMGKLPIVSIFSILLVGGYGVFSYYVNNFIPYSTYTGSHSLLKNEKQVVDYTYQKSGKKEFGICSISEPLFINSIWSFMYFTYGKQKYGYLPAWTGQKQILNANLIPDAHKKYKDKFIIEEPLTGIPDFAPEATYFIENTQNVLEEKKIFGTFKVQHRIFTKENSGSIENIYTPKQIENIKSIIHIEPRFSCDLTYSL